MAMDKYAKLDLFIRTAFREFWCSKHASSRQKVLVVPAFEIPRYGSVDLYIHPKAGTTLGLILRSDYVAAYKHAVGQVVGGLAHYHQMSDREMREALRASKSHPDTAELKQGKIEVLKLAKQLQTDQKGGKIIVALATDLPEVPQQAKELEANFFPIAKILQTGLTATVKKKKICQSVEFYAVSQDNDPPKVAPLADAIKPLLKAAPT
jgi:hypothetical protein